MALLLSVIVNEFELRLDKDIRKLLTLIAMISEPGNIDVYFMLKMKVSIVDMQPT
jgi:hypothetical protein